MTARADFAVRLAHENDAASVAEMLRDSILQLCVSDHQNDPVLLQNWLANKTPEGIGRWINSKDSLFLVAERDGSIVSVGALSRDGEILLNYVAPAARFQGISRRMIEALEKRARDKGLHQCRLSSTGTARRFYLSCGYREEGSAKGLFGPTIYKMSKDLRPRSG